MHVHAAWRSVIELVADVVTPSPICSCDTIVCTEKPCGLRLLGGDEGTRNVDSFGGDSLKK